MTDQQNVYELIQKRDLWKSDISGELYQVGPKIPKHVWEEIGTKVSTNEKQPIMKVDPSKIITLRFDGNNFSNIIPRLKKAGFLEQGFSTTFAKIIQGATKKVMEKFNAISGFTQSDEITIIINKQVTDGATHTFSGRRDKLETLGASIISTHFVRELSKIKELPDNIDVLFDARMAVWDTLEDAFEVILWRAYDCSVNGVSTAVANFGALPNVRKDNTGAKLAWLVSNNKLPLDPHEAYGTLFVKIKKQLKAINRITNEEIDITRGIIDVVLGNVLINVKNKKITIVNEAFVIG